MDQDKEIVAMATIAKALDSFTQEESEVIERIIRWAASRYRIQKVAVSGQPNAGIKHEEDAEATEEQKFEDLAELYHAAMPKTDSEKALIAGFWLTNGQNKSEFTAQDVNTDLKNLGHGVGNITDAFTGLIERKPALVMQTSKSGTSRQARKKYKLTRAGLDHVHRMLRGDADTSTT